MSWAADLCRFFMVFMSQHYKPQQGHKYEFVLSMKLSLTAEEVYRCLALDGSTGYLQYKASVF